MNIAAVHAPVMPSTGPSLDVFARYIALDLDRASIKKSSWMVALGKAKTGASRKDRSGNEAGSARVRGKTPVAPGAKVFEGRNIRHKYRARGMKLEIIRMKRLTKFFRLFRGKFDLLKRKKKDSDSEG